MTTCKLCLQNKKLIKKSHIIPDFMYRQSGLYDERHKLRRLTVKSIYKKVTDLISVSSGEYDKNILCATCDNEVIGQYETYAREVLFGGKFSEHELPSFSNIANEDGSNYTLCQNIDYIKFKLFLLSILWRASISIRDFFQDVDLGPEKEEQLRGMILNNNPGSENDFPIFFYTYLNDNKLSKDIIGMPNYVNNEGIETNTFLMGGIFYVFYIGNNTLNNEDIRDQTINKNNQMRILHIPQGQGWNYILGFTGLR